MTQPAKTLSGRASYEMRRTGRPPRPPTSLPYRLLARSCPKCGNFITTPPEALRTDSGVKLPRCIPCESRAVMARTKRDQEYAKRQAHLIYEAEKRRQSVSTETPPANDGKMWTGPELETAAREELTAQQVAFMLGRSYYAVKNVRRRMSEPRYERLAGVANDETPGEA